MNRRSAIFVIRAVVFFLILSLAATVLPFEAMAKKKQPKPVLSKNSAILQPGKSLTLKVKLKGSKKAKKKKLKWSVSNKGILSIKKLSKKKYKITARRPGTAKVTVKAGKKKAVCKVKVTEPSAAPVSVKRIPVYSGDPNLDYLLSRMCKSARVTEDMSDEAIAWKLFKWVAKHCVYEYEALLKYGKKAEQLYPPYGLKLIYDLEGREEEIAAYKKECDARQAAGEITYSAVHVKDRGKYLAVKDPDQFGTTLECYQRLTGDCRYMASIFTNLCEHMGLRSGINIGKTYSALKDDFTLHYISFVYIDGKKYYVDPGSAVHHYTREKKFKSRYYKLSAGYIKSSYRLGKGKKEF